MFATSPDRLPQPDNLQLYLVLCCACFLICFCDLWSWALPPLLIHFPPHHSLWVLYWCPVKRIKPHGENTVSVLALTFPDCPVICSFEHTVLLCFTLPYVFCLFFIWLSSCLRPPVCTLLCCLLRLFWVFKLWVLIVFERSSDATTQLYKCGTV